MNFLPDTHSLVWFALDDPRPSRLPTKTPFDRLLIAQAIVEGIPIISVDPAFDAYPVRRIW